MLRIFTLKFEEKLEGFNDELLYQFLSDKEIITWESYFYERKNDHYWTVVVHYKFAAASSPAIPGKSRQKRDEKYKELLTENDWPLFKRLKEWRGEVSKKQGVPPYIIFNNVQLAKIAVTRPKSLNAIQEIEGIGNAKREKYGTDILKILEVCEPPRTLTNGEN